MLAVGTGLVDETHWGLNAKIERVGRAESDFGKSRPDAERPAAALRTPVQDDTGRLAAAASSTITTAIAAPPRAPRPIRAGSGSRRCSFAAAATILPRRG